MLARGHRAARRRPPLLAVCLLVGCDRAPSLPPAEGPSASTAPAPAPTVPPSAPTAAPVPSPAPSVEAPREAGERTWRYDDSPVGRMEVVVSVPPGTGRLPVLVALHGWGEALKGPQQGARGWRDDYALGRAEERLSAPPLTEADLQRFVDPTRLSRINEALAGKPYGGLIVVCPFTPTAMLDGFRSVEPMARFVVDELLARVYRETPALGTPATTGIDGVSLGGRAAILIGLERPEAFGSIAALQAAFYDHELAEVDRRARAARAKRPDLSLRLLTSTGDSYRGTNGALAERLRAAGLDVRLDVVVGPHTYAFNRGPGAYEMLLFHDRALRGEVFLPDPQPRENGDESGP